MSLALPGSHSAPGLHQRAPAPLGCPGVPVSPGRARGWAAPSASQTHPKRGWAAPGAHPGPCPPWPCPVGVTHRAPPPVPALTSRPRRARTRGGMEPAARLCLALCLAGVLPAPGEQRVGGAEPPPHPPGTGNPGMGARAGGEEGWGSRRAPLSLPAVGGSPRPVPSPRSGSPQAAGGRRAGSPTNCSTTSSPTTPAPCAPWRTRTGRSTSPSRSPCPRSSTW